MATEHTTVFIPIIEENRMGEYGAGDFEITTRLADSGIDIQFTAQAEEDRNLFMIAPGEVFFVAADTTVVFENGPEVAAPADKNVAVIHIVSTFEWAPILAQTGQPVAEWWALEDITISSFETFVDGHDLEVLAFSRGQTETEYRAAILSGEASINALLLDELPVSFGNLATAEDDSSTLGLRAWASYGTEATELDALSALATIKHLAPALDDHPVLSSAITTVSTSDVAIHVRFVYWKPGEMNATTETDKGGFEPVPLNSKISLQRRNPNPEYFTIVEETVTDNSGQVALIAPRAELNAVDLNLGERLVFRVEVPNGAQFDIQYQHNRPAVRHKPRLKWGAIDDAWITEGRLSTDDVIESLDFLVGYENNIVGTADQPIEYYAGLPVFLQIHYPVVFTSGAGAMAKFKSEIRKAPKGLIVEIRSAVDATLMGFFRTDEHGQVWGMLAFWDENLKLPLEVVVKYDIEDESIKLPSILGEVVEGGNTFSSYSSNKDILNSLEISNKLNASLGKTTAIDGIAVDLATIQVGFVEVPADKAISEFSSTDGRHAGMIHALQQIRYMHQWFHHLTDGFRVGTVDQSWAAKLAQHNGAQGNSTDGQYMVHLPGVRILQSFRNYIDPNTHIIRDERVYGEVDIDKNDIPNFRWWLTLYGHDSFKMNQKLTAHNDTLVTQASFDIPLADKVQFWRHHTIWHEFSHTVFNTAIDRLLDLDHHASLVTAKDLTTSGIIDQTVNDGWSVLEEAIAAVPEAALSGKLTGIMPDFSPTPIASPRYMKLNIDTTGDGIADMLLSGGMTALGVLDWRLGLRVPMAFTWGIWTALQQLAGFDTLDSIFNGPPTGNDLSDRVPYLTSNAAAQLFQNLIWGPLISLKTPQDAGPPQQWDDLDGSQPGFSAADAEGKGAAGPPYVSPNTNGHRRIRINGPSTHRFMEILQQQYWTNLTVAQKNEIQKLFGDVNDTGGDVSFYLWFDF